jgi:hypothetical protein
MNINKFPVVTHELINALKETFPITEITLAKSHSDIIKTLGMYDIINFLEYVNDVQTNPDSE